MIEMKITSGLTIPGLAQFLLKFMKNPSEGTIVDALREQGATDDEVVEAIESISGQLDSPQIDINSPDVGLDTDFDTPELIDGETLSDMVGTPDFSGGGVGLDAIDAIPEQDLDMEQATVEDPDLTIDTDDAKDLRDSFIEENPDATEDEIEAYLRDIAGIEVKKGAIDGVTFTDAVNIILQENPGLTTDDVKNILTQVGAPASEINDVVTSLPINDEPTVDRRNPTDWYSRMQEIKREDPGIREEELMSKLEGEGASPDEARAAVNSDSSFNEGDEVGGQRISKVLFDEINQERYFVLSNDKYYTLDELIQLAESELDDSLDSRVEAHLASQSFSDEEGFDVKAKGWYSKRLADTKALREEVVAKLSGKEKSRKLAEQEVLLAAEENFLNEVVANSFTLDEAEYVRGLPRYQTSIADETNDLGLSSMGAEMVEALYELADEEAAIDWKNEVTAGADFFLEDIDTYIIGDATEVTRQARRHIRAKTSHLTAEDANPIIKEFLANVERGRRKAVKDLTTKKRSSVEENELPDNFEGGLF